MARAIWNGQVIAESDEVLLVEGNVYFPEATVDASFLRESDHHTVCPWKGTASYHHVEVNGERNANAAWFYPDPKAAAAEIKDHIAFWKGVEVSR